MAKYQQYETVLLKDGRLAVLVEAFEPDTYIADVGLSPKDWDTIDITDNDIMRLATEKEKQENYDASIKQLKEQGLCKPEHTMKLRFEGETFYYGIDGLTNGKIYEAWEEDDDYYRVIDDSGEDYIYPKTNPHAPDGSTTKDRWEIVEE